MDHKDDFGGNTPKEPNDNDRSFQRTENQYEEVNFPPISEPQWYGVSYHGSSEMPPKRSGKAGLVAFIVALCLLFSMLALVGGILIGRVGQTPTQILPTGEEPGDGTPTVDEGVIPGKDDGYDYTGIELNRTEGVGSLEGGSAGDRAVSLQQAVRAVQDSVVEITATAISNRGTVTAGAGSGVIIHKDGIIITNNHVIEGFTDIYVIVSDHAALDENGNFKQYKYQATVRGRDEDKDIAVLKIEPQTTLTVAKLGVSKNVIVAEEVFAIGNPLGELGGTVTNGIISAVSRSVVVDDVVMTLLQTNAAINSGNSGGGLFNLAGELIGVVNAKFSASGVEGLGFAIPIDIAAASAEELLEYGYIKGIPSLGVTVSNGTTGNFFNQQAVAYVSDAGSSTVLKKNDIIVKIGEGTSAKTVSSASEVNSAIRAYKVGDTVKLTIYRDGVETTVNVTLTEYIPK